MVTFILLFLFLFIFETEMLPLIVIEAELTVGAGEPEAEPPSRTVVYRLQGDLGSGAGLIQQNRREKDGDF